VLPFSSVKVVFFVYVYLCGAVADSDRSMMVELEGSTWLTVPLYVVVFSVVSRSTTSPASTGGEPPARSTATAALRMGSIFFMACPPLGVEKWRCAVITSAGHAPSNRGNG